MIKPRQNSFPRGVVTLSLFVLHRLPAMVVLNRNLRLFAYPHTGNVCHIFLPKNKYLSLSFALWFGWILFFLTLAMASSEAADWLSCLSFLSQYIFCYNAILTSHLQDHLLSCCFKIPSETQFFPTFIYFTQAMCQLCQPHQKYLIILSESSSLNILTPEFEILNCTISHSPLSQR